MIGIYFSFYFSSMFPIDDTNKKIITLHINIQTIAFGHVEKKMALLAAQFARATQLVSLQVSIFKQQIQESDRYHGLRNQ